jgi:predicted nucleotidyltransferase
MQRQKENEIKEIPEVIKETVHCEKIYLFGSYAYGEPNKDSDLDFYVVIPDDADRPIEVMQKIQVKLGRRKMIIPIDIVAGRSSKFAQKSKLPTMEQQIAREGVVLYERSGFSQQMV